MSDDEAPKTRQCSACGKTKPLAEFAGQREHCRACDDAEAAYRRGIEERLNADRPARAAADDRSWREDVYAWARNHMPNETNIVRRQAQRDVDRRERDATHRTNQLVRQWMEGHAPLFFSDVGAWPLRVGPDHVRLDAATVADGRVFKRDKLAAAKRAHDSEVITADGVGILSEWAADHGYLLLSQLGDLPPRRTQDEGAA